MNRKESNIIGIDAINIRRGGGVTHLVELLNNTNQNQHSFNKLVIWGPLSTLRKIDDKPWIKKINPLQAEKNLVIRTIWQIFKLSAEVKKEGCSILFVPGGSYAGTYLPVVTMSQNLLPFEINELKRFGFSFMTLKLLMLRFTQSYTFSRSNGVIFLTEYARKKIKNIVKKKEFKTKIIPHGLDIRFRSSPKNQKNIISYDNLNPYKILYVSIIDQYKHQWHVVNAVNILRKEGYPICLDLVGPSYSPALRRLNSTIEKVDPLGQWVSYQNEIPFNELHKRYANADLGLFASSCENMPNILLEMMASGLPIVSSDRGPMPDILLDGGLYFDPEDPKNIASAIRKTITSEKLREDLAHRNYLNAQKFSWQKCSYRTFSFIDNIIIS